MKILNKILSAVILVSLLTACEKSTTKENESIDPESTVEAKAEEKVELAKVEVAISGMTCEIGCAKLIQSKLYKTEGVKNAEVVFIDSIGRITYDKNKVSKEELKQVIEKTAGGDLYSVVAVNEVELDAEMGQ